MLVMVEEGWERARDARRVANVVLPMHGWPDRIRDGMLKRATESVVAFALLLPMVLFALDETNFSRALDYKFNPYCAALLVIYCSVTYIRTNYIVLTVTLTYRPTYHVRPFRHNRDRDPQHPNHGASRSPIGGNVETQPIVHHRTLV